MTERAFLHETSQILFSAPLVLFSFDVGMLGRTRRSKHLSKVDLSDWQKDHFHIIIYIQTPKILWYHLKSVPQPWNKPFRHTDKQSCSASVLFAVSWIHSLSVSAGFYFGTFVDGLQQFADTSAAVCFSSLIKSTNETSVHYVIRWACVGLKTAVFLRSWQQVLNCLLFKPFKSLFDQLLFMFIVLLHLSSLYHCSSHYFSPLFSHHLLHSRWHTKQKPLCEESLWTGSLLCFRTCDVCRWFYL